MVYRIYMWLKSFLFDKFLCQLCGKRQKYSTSAIIKVRYEQGKIMDFVICDSCATNLENTKQHGTGTT